MLVLARRFASWVERQVRDGLEPSLGDVYRLQDLTPNRVVAAKVLTRDAFIESDFRSTLDDVTHDHAVFDRDRCGLDEIAASIVPFAERRWHVHEKGNLHLPGVA
jgi:hypothetical protein